MNVSTEVVSHQSSHCDVVFSGLTRTLHGQDKSDVEVAVHLSRGNPGAPPQVLVGQWETAGFYLTLKFSIYLSIFQTGI